VQRIEELVLASSGADAFEVVFALAAAQLFARRTGRPSPRDRRNAQAMLDRAAQAWRWLGAKPQIDVPDDVVAQALRVLERALAGDLDALDAVFEQLVTRVGKGDKGQFFTPRHVVDLAVRALSLVDGERVVDPACGSGAFLAHARMHANVDTWGCDVDARAIRVAKLLAIATGADPDARVRSDALARGAAWPERIDVIATNPPFAGEVRLTGFELGRLLPRAERDAFFLERAVNQLRPGGRMGIVLPHGKIGAPAWAPLRTWLVARARVFAVVSLPRETFMPHTSQRTALLFAKKRAQGESTDRGEKVFLGTSERAGKDSAGDPIYRTGTPQGAGWRALDHDMDEIADRLVRFLDREGFA
jgi:type I restriction enzyme M protein